MTRLESLCVEGSRLLHEMGFVRRRGRGAAFSVNGADDPRRKRIRELITKIAAAFPSGLTAEQMSMEVSRRAADLRTDRSGEGWRKFVKEIEEIAKAAGVVVKSRDDALTDAMFEGAADNHVNAAMSLVPPAMSDARRQAVADEQMRNAARYGSSRR